MREWVPVPSSARGRLTTEALAAFGEHGYDAVAVGALARAAGVTTGSLYHHFGSKLGLYAVVRQEVERRLLDRMEGAVAAVGPTEPGAAGAALLVGFDYVTGHRFARLLAEVDPGGGPDPVEALLVRMDGDPRGRLLAAAWRAALLAVTGGTTASRCRAALASITLPR